MERAIIIPGARKAGTSSLFAALAVHPDVAAGKFKEPQFFALDDATVEARMEWYVGIYGGVGQLEGRTALDASTFYLMSERAPRLIGRHIGDPRVVIVLRDPVERAFAAHAYVRARVPSPESREFVDIVAGLESYGSDPGLPELEAGVLTDAIGDGAVPARYYTESFHAEQYGAPFETRLEDPLNILRYFTESCYSEYVMRWQRAFPGSVHLVAFERLLAEPAAVLSEIHEFCGLERVPELEELPRENPTRVGRTRMARWILSRTAQRTPGGLLDGLVRLARSARIDRALRTRVLTTRRPPLDRGLRARCRVLLEAEYAWWMEHHPAISAWWSRPKS